MTELLTSLFFLNILLFVIIVSYKYKSILMFTFMLSIILSYSGRGIAIKYNIINSRYMGTEEGFILSNLYVCAWTLVVGVLYVLVRGILKSNANFEVIDNKKKQIVICLKTRMLLLLFFIINLFGVIHILQTIGFEYLWLSRMSALNGIGYWAIMSTIYLYIVIFFLCAFIITKTRINWFIALHLVPATLFTMIYGSRASFIEPLIILIISFSLSRKISKKLLIVYIGFVCFVVVFFPILTGRDSFQGVASIFASTPEFDVLWSLVDAKYDDKIFTYLSPIYWMFGDSFKDGNSIITQMFFLRVWESGAQLRPGAIGESILNLGWLGGLLIAGVAGSILGFIDNLISKKRRILDILIYGMCIVLLMKWVRGDEFRVFLNIAIFILSLSLIFFTNSFFRNLIITYSKGLTFIMRRR
ncbi:hypothetical protein WMW72_03165 [Paenibacillus filicis]|uniref:Oligosaccharide repeat unit polymerase n=1 Tax=Paenibacillus filicis TaxID=669464 RepID=A0ABU9DDH0_9BACL